jgi:hypothetical protein
MEQKDWEQIYKKLLEKKRIKRDTKKVVNGAERKVSAEERKRKLEEIRKRVEIIKGKEGEEVERRDNWRTKIRRNDKKFRRRNI